MSSHTLADDRSVVQPAKSELRILHIIASIDSSSGGPIEGILRQAEILKQLGVRREIVSLDDPNAPFLKDIDIKVYALGEQGDVSHARRSWLPWKYYLFARKFIPWLRENVSSYDFVVVNGIWNYTTFAASRVLPQQSVPYVVFTHGMLDPWFRRTYPLKHIAKQLVSFISEGPLLKGAKSVLFTSEDEMHLSRNAFMGLSYTPRVVLYGTADLPANANEQIAAFRDKVPQLRGRPFLLFLSRIHRKKGCDILIKAFHAIASDFPELDLVIAGPDQVGLVAKLKHIASELGVGDRIHWPGMLTGNAKYGAFRATEAFILPSHQENFGIVVAEAMAAGKPVLITNKVNIWREVVDSGAGIVSEDDFSGVLEMTRQFLAMSPEARLTMGDAARRCFLKNFEVERAALSFIDLVKVLS